MSLPAFKYHPDPLSSGSVVPSPGSCSCCGKARGHVYAGPVYADIELEDALCPWCIADGSAHRRFDALFVDSEAFPDGVPSSSVELISQQTPGFNAWQGEHWPACCGDATAFIGPFGITELRARDYRLESLLMPHIVHTMGVSGSAATRLLSSLNREHGPTAYLFRCLVCDADRFHIDSP